MMRIVHNEQLHGIGIDEQTRCAHWHSELDIIAIKFKCCEKWFPCFDCHLDIADHEPQVWAIGRRDEKAVMCGECGRQLSINEYLACESTCPQCSSKFNPGCANHYHLYFESEGTVNSSKLPIT